MKQLKKNKQTQNLITFFNSHREVFQFKKNLLELIISQKVTLKNSRSRQ